MNDKSHVVIPRRRGAAPARPSPLESSFIAALVSRTRASIASILLRANMYTYTRRRIINNTESRSDFISHAENENPSIVYGLRDTRDVVSRDLTFSRSNSNDRRSRACSARRSDCLSRNVYVRRRNELCARRTTVRRAGQRRTIEHYATVRRSYRSALFTPFAIRKRLVRPAKTAASASNPT